jgi:hypothetical protein
VVAASPALKDAQIAWAKQQGYQRLVTGNELRNEPIPPQRGSATAESGRLLLRGPLFSS